MANASLGTLRSQIANLIKENARLQAEARALREKLTEVDGEYTTVVNMVLSGAPECWGDDNGPRTVIAYVESLEGRSGGMAGHREDCDCWNG